MAKRVPTEDPAMEKSLEIERLERRKKLLSLPLKSIDQLIAAVKNGFETGRIDLRSKGSQVSIGFRDDLVSETKIDGMKKEENTSLLATVISLGNFLIHKAKTLDEVNAKLLGVPSEYEAQAKFIAKELVNSGVIKEIDYIYHAETPRLYLQRFHGTPKLRPLSELVREPFACADITLMTADEIGLHPVHFEVSINDINNLINRLAEIKKEIEEFSTERAKTK